jgi:hypothetical protein
MGWEGREVVIICFKILPNNLARINLKIQATFPASGFEPWTICM